MNSFGVHRLLFVCIFTMAGPWNTSSVSCHLSLAHPTSHVSFRYLCFNLVRAIILNACDLPPLTNICWPSLTLEMSLNGPCAVSKITPHFISLLSPTPKHSCIHLQIPTYSYPHMQMFVDTNAHIAQIHLPKFCTATVCFSLIYSFFLRKIYLFIYLLLQISYREAYVYSSIALQSFRLPYLDSIFFLSTHSDCAKYLLLRL